MSFREIFDAKVRQSKIDLVDTLDFATCVASPLSLAVGYFFRSSPPLAYAAVALGALTPTICIFWRQRLHTELLQEKMKEQKKSKSSSK